MMHHYIYKILINIRFSYRYYTYSSLSSNLQFQQVQITNLKPNSKYIFSHIIKITTDAVMLNKYIWCWRMQVTSRWCWRKNNWIAKKFAPSVERNRHRKKQRKIKLVSILLLFSETCFFFSLIVMILLHLKNVAVKFVNVAIFVSLCFCLHLERHTWSTSEETRR